MADYPCPSCGAPVTLRSNASLSAVCGYCQTLVVRRGVEVEAIGKVAELPPDMTPFQVGTQAYDGKTAFGIVGRLRLAWADGFWNEWFFVTDDGRKGWLAEAQGTYAISYELAEPPHANTRAAVDRWVQDPGRSAIIGNSVTLAGKSYTVTDIKKVACVSCEGELPVISPSGHRALTFDLMGAPDAFATIEVSDEGRRYFTGRYVEWDELRASNLKVVEGWA
jgi:hypothetical protein